MGRKKKTRIPDLGAASRLFQDSEDDEQLFRAAIEELEVAPDKDSVAPQGRRPGLPPKRPLPRKANLSPDDRIDLHRMNRAEASQALTRFVHRAAGEGLSSVLVITGKGLSSPGRVSVLKQELARWLGNEGRGLVQAYSPAPRSLGGNGAFVLWLRG